MPTIPSIKSLLMPEFSVEFAPTNVFVLEQGEVKSVSKDQALELDNDYFFVEIDSVYNIPVIQKKL